MPKKLEKKNNVSVKNKRQRNGQDTAQNSNGDGNDFDTCTNGEDNKSPRSDNFSFEEEESLIKLYREALANNSFDSGIRHAIIYEGFAGELTRAGFAPRSAKNIQLKVKNLKASFALTDRKISSGMSKDDITFVHYELMLSFLGQRAQYNNRACMDSLGVDSNKSQSETMSDCEDVDLSNLKEIATLVDSNFRTYKSDDDESIADTDEENCAPKRSNGSGVGQGTERSTSSGSPNGSSGSQSGPGVKRTAPAAEDKGNKKIIINHSRRVKAPEHNFYQHLIQQDRKFIELEEMRIRQQQEEAQRNAKAEQERNEQFNSLSTVLQDFLNAQTRMCEARAALDQQRAAALPLAQAGQVVAAAAQPRAVSSGSIQARSCPIPSVGTQQTVRNTIPQTSTTNTNFRMVGGQLPLALNPNLLNIDFGGIRIPSSNNPQSSGQQRKIIFLKKSDLPKQAKKDDEPK